VTELGEFKLLRVDQGKSYRSVGTGWHEGLGQREEVVVVVEAVGADAAAASNPTSSEKADGDSESTGAAAAAVVDTVTVTVTYADSDTVFCGELKLKVPAAGPAGSVGPTSLASPLRDVLFGCDYNYTGGVFAGGVSESECGSSRIEFEQGAGPDGRESLGEFHLKLQ
jgi:hypothetical protein